MKMYIFGCSPSSPFPFIQSEAIQQPLLPDWPVAAECWRTGRSRGKRLADGANGQDDIRRHWARSDADEEPNEAPEAWS